VPNLKLTNIQILRGLAAVWVVVYHTLGLTLAPHGGNRILTWAGEYGYFGVDIFFVVSGFVIYYSVYSKKISALAFFRRRAERIVPPYLLLTAVLFLATLILPSLFHSLKASFDHFLRSIFYLSFTGYQFPVLYIGWTLEYEMFFYVLASAALAFGARAFNRLPVIISALVVIGVAFTKMLGALGPVGFLTNAIILEFCFGFVIASIFLSNKIEKYNVAALIAALLAASLVDPTHRAILAGLPSAAMLYVCLALNHLVTLPRYVRTPLSTIGDASYSIYLIQVFSLPIIDKLLRFAPDAVGTNSIVLLATSFTIFLGWTFFKLVETPILDALKVRRQRNAAPLMSA
jgi:exopolysaccharide production protein ExoZ